MLDSLSNKTGKYLEKRIKVRVVEENQAFCADQNHITGHWGMTLVIILYFMYLLYTTLRFSSFVLLVSLV